MQFLLAFGSQFRVQEEKEGDKGAGHEQSPIAGEQL